MSVYDYIMFVRFFFIIFIYYCLSYLTFKPTKDDLVSGHEHVKFKLVSISSIDDDFRARFLDQDSITYRYYDRYFVLELPNIKEVNDFYNLV